LTPPHVLIAGGGIAGLAAAYELSIRGVPFVLLEASDRVGGLILTARIDGYTVDSGADSMLALKPAALQLCEELGLTPRLISSSPPRRAYIFAHGRLHPIPSPSVFGIPTTAAGIDSYELLSAEARAELRRRASTPDAVAKRPVSNHDDESVADFFRRQFGPETVSLIAEPLLGGIHAGDVERLSMGSVAPRLVAAEAEHGGVLQGFLRADGASTTPSGDNGLFRSFDGGMGQLTAAIESRLPPASVRLRSEVQTIARAASEWDVRTASEALRASALIVAAPAHAAARVFSAADPALAALCAQTPYVSTASVALSFPRASVGHPLDGSGFVVARRHASLRITACTWVSSKWIHRAPAGLVLLRAFLGGATDPEAAELGDEALVEIAARDVSQVLQITGAPLLTRVHRWIRAGAQHNVGHAARLRLIDAYLARTPGIFVAGSGFHSIGVPDCIASGRAAAGAAADYVKMLL
jgi:protoporphyrinogen/coproporphyrinogen III oxidase